MNDEEGLKIAINNFVWMHAPGKITLDEAESLATKVFILFLEVRRQNPTAEPPDGDST